MLVQLFTVYLAMQEAGNSSVYTGLWVRQSKKGVSIPGRVRVFSLLHRVVTGCGTQPTSYPGAAGAPLPAVKRQGPDVNHSPPSITEIMNEWSYIFTPPYAFMARPGTDFPLFNDALSTT